MENLKFKTDLLVAGSGTSGVAAAVQAARLGVDVVLVGETDWLGGMLTAAGVSCVDGNHLLPSGLYGEFRNRLYTHYGGPDALKTGWVSHTCFEPRVGNDVLHHLVGAEKNIHHFKGYAVTEVFQQQGRIQGAAFRKVNGETLNIRATCTIDATELGDVIALTGTDCFTGRESRNTWNESPAPRLADSFIQDLTYVAILEEGSPILVEQPDDYDPERFRNCCREFSDLPADAGLVDARTMLNYGRLPNGKYMINWPKKGNDYYVNALEMDRNERLKAWENARKHTLEFVYFLQQELGFKNLGLAENEFPTDDHLALIPYHRESRRIKGLQTLILSDITHPYAHPERALFKYGIAVGDYPLDHHHECVSLPEPEVFPPVPAFNVPAGALIPQGVEGLLAAEKSISVSHVVNGCSRLQPVVMQIGQAAGVLAALSIKQNSSTASLNIRSVQQVLLDAGCWQMPFNDINPADPWFQSCQRIGLCGIMEGEPLSEAWANKFLFHPLSNVESEEFTSFLDKAAGSSDVSSLNKKSDSGLVLSEACRCVGERLGKNGTEAFAYFSANEAFRHYLEQNRDALNSHLTRAACALLLDIAFRPFEKKLHFH